MNASQGSLVYDVARNSDDYSFGTASTGSEWSHL